MATRTIIALTLYFSGLLIAADSDAAALYVYNASPGARMPGFAVDPAWPKPLPHNWMLNWSAAWPSIVTTMSRVYSRPRTMTTEDAGLEDAVPGAKDAHGEAIDGMGHARPHGPVADCCKASPSVLEFDTDGKLLRAWGGQADPGFIGGKCKAEAGCIWPNSEHGIYVDQNDNVWLSGNSANVGAKIPWTTNDQGGDGFCSVRS